MATLYKAEIVSYWINYEPKELEEIIKKALKEKGVEIKVNVKRK